MANKLIELRHFINCALKFDEKSHSYTFNGNKLISVTQLLAKHHLSPSYEGVDETKLKQSAEYGNMVHKEIEDYIKKGIMSNSIELNNFIKWLENSGYQVVDSEYLVCNDIIGGKVDLLLKHIETGVYVIADIKTTSIIHHESVSWQLSIYNYLEEDVALVGACLHFLKDGTLEVTSVPLKAQKDIEKLIECERKGEIFKYELSGIDRTLVDLSKVETLIANYKALIKQAEVEQKSLHEQIKNEMESRNIKTLDLPNMKITIVADSIREIIDTKALKQEQPELYEKYKKVSIVKGSLKITLKERKEDEA